MIADALKEIVKLARHSAEPTFKDLDDGRTRLLVNATDGSHESLDVLPAKRAHQLRSLDSLVALAKAVKEHSPGAKPTLWYDRKGVTLVCDDATRWDTAAVKLNHAAPFLFLSSESAQAWYDQKQFILMLRTKLRNCLGPHQNLIGLLRTLKFVVHSAGDSDVQHGRSSVGKSLKAELMGTGSIPEEITLDVPVFNSVFTAGLPVACAIDIDPDNQKLRLLVLPDQLDFAVQRAEDAVGEFLNQTVGAHDVDVPIFHGVP